MGQQTDMSSSTGLQQSSQHTQPSNQQQQQQHGKKGVQQRSKYNAKAMAQIRDSLKPYEQQQEVHRLINQGYDEDSARQMVNQKAQDALRMGPPALPPRSRHNDGLNTSTRYISESTTGSSSIPPPPPPRSSANSNQPPPTPPRGATPPPTPNHISNSNHYQTKSSISNNPINLLRRMSPIPTTPSSRVSNNTTSSISQRGTSPVTTGHPLKAPNSREIQQHVQMQLQSMHLVYPMDSSAEPPAPYPMGTAATSNPPPPPSYSQSLAMRQSPTLSSSSSDYRRSPGPLQSNIIPYAMMPQPTNIPSVVKNTAPSPIPAPPSPASSMLSSSSKASSMQAWSSRQAKTQSPIIMQSVKSTHVQKPILQTATGIAPVNIDHAQNQLSNLSINHMPNHVQLSMDTDPNGRTSSLPPAPPPPSYEFYQQKQQQPPPPPPPTMVDNSQRSVSPTPLAPPSRESKMLPPPPPYPSTRVSLKDNPNGNLEPSLVNAKQVSGKPDQVIISTAKVVSSNRHGEGKQKALVAATESDMSRSESPASDSQTIPASPISSMSSGPQSYNLSENSVNVPLEVNKATHHTSPKPERKQLSPEKEETRRGSVIRYYSPQAYMFFMEQHIEKVMNLYEERKKRWFTLERELVPLPPDTQATMRMMLRKKETEHLRMRRAKLCKKDFKKIKKIGEGAFGEVCLVRAINSVGDKRKFGFYAMKTLRKSHVVEKNQVAHVIAEKDILAEADNDWIVKLNYSFQDKDHLYFIMEYVPGGDLMNLLIKKERFDEDLARFYIAELTCAVESVHSMGFIHRDIKPDNILIGIDGHIKLTDFGLCTGFRWTHNSQYYPKNGVNHYRQDSMDPGTLDLESGRCSCAAISSSGMKPLERRKFKQKQRCMAHSLVGTPNYIAPEVLNRINGDGYDQSCDWWSVGVILYEMIIGHPPFLSDTPAQTQKKILNWSEYLRIPSRPPISHDAQDLIRGLITDAESRLGSKGGGQDIKSHSFFKSIDFSQSLRTQRAPYKPNITHPTDTSNFDKFDDPCGIEEDPSDTQLSSDDHRFYEFTFRRFFILNDFEFKSMTQPVPPPHHLTGESKSSGATAASEPGGPVYV